jgi:hypothetical protein
MIVRNNTFTPIFTNTSNATPTSNQNTDSTDNNQPVNRNNGRQTARNAGRTAKAHEKDAKESSKNLERDFLSKNDLFGQSIEGLNFSFSENGTNLADFTKSLEGTNNTAITNGETFTQATNFQFAKDIQLPQFDASAVNEATTASALETSQALEGSNNTAKTNIGDAVSAGAEALKKAGVGNNKMQQMLGLVAQIPPLVASATALFSGVFSIPAALAVVAQIVRLLSQAKSLMSSARQDVDVAKEKGKISDEEAKQAHEELDKIENQFKTLESLKDTVQQEIDKQQNAVAQLQPKQGQNQANPLQLGTNPEQKLEPMNLEQIDSTLALMNANKASFAGTVSSLGTNLNANFANISQTADSTLFNPYISYLEQQKQALENQKAENTSTNTDDPLNGSLPPSLLFTSGDTSTGQDSSNNPNGQNPQGNQDQNQAWSPFATSSTIGTNPTNNYTTTISPSMMSFNSPLNMTA